jgi:hypothetical protein
MESYPFIIGEDASGRRLVPTGEGERPYEESWLQELIRAHPDILPVAEIEPVFSPLATVGREVMTDSGPIDNLFVSHRGYLVLVETKLWRNPEARREVVAQAIDYGSSLAKWNYARLNDSVRAYTRQYEGGEADLADWVEKRLGPVEGGKGFFEESVTKNLRLGRFLTLIVGDKIRQSVVEMVSYVNKFPGLAMDVALVELQCFRFGDKEQWPLLVVPRVVARTEIVERSVVQVTVTREGEPLVEVRQEKAAGEGSVLKRISLTEEAFWELLRRQSPGSYDAASRLVGEYKEKDGVEISPAETSVSVRLDVQGTGRQISLFYVNKKGGLNVWTKFIGEKLASMGFPPQIGNAYERQLRELMRMPEGRTDFARPITDVDTERFKSIVDEFIREIQTARPPSD